MPKTSGNPFSMKLEHFVLAGSGLFTIFEFTRKIPAFFIRLSWLSAELFLFLWER